MYDQLLTLYIYNLTFELKNKSAGIICNSNSKCVQSGGDTCNSNSKKCLNSALSLVTTTTS